MCGASEMDEQSPQWIEWKSRVRIEKQQLDERLQKLLEFICSLAYRELSTAEQYRLSNQFKAMLDYQSQLHERIVNDFK